MSLAEKAFNLRERSPGGPAWIRAMRRIHYIKSSNGLCIFETWDGEISGSDEGGWTTFRVDQRNQRTWLGVNYEVKLLLKEYGDGYSEARWPTGNQQSPLWTVTDSNFVHGLTPGQSGQRGGEIRVTNGVGSQTVPLDETRYSDQYFYDIYYAMGYTELPFYFIFIACNVGNSYSPYTYASIYSSPWMRAIDLDIVPGTDLLASLPGVLSGQNIQGESVELNIEHLNLDFSITSIT